jgi:hypothetical protein
LQLLCFGKICQIGFAFGAVQKDANAIEPLLRRIQPVRRALLTIAIASILFFVGQYLGIPVVGASPSVPTFNVQIGLVTPLPSSDSPQIYPREWLLRRVKTWPGANIHPIDDKSGACAAHAEEDPIIVYKPAMRAHITGFRMVHFLQPGSLQPGFPKSPVLRNLTPELEKDCGNAYDLIIFPFSVLSRARLD